MDHKWGANNPVAARKQEEMDLDQDGWADLLPPLFAKAGIAVPGALAIVPLTGGVSSDIVRVELGDGQVYCAKRALPKLKVASDWQAPLERNHYEIAWLQKAGEIVPGAVPGVIGEDRAHGIAVLDYLPPQDYLVWKAELLAGRADPRVPAALANVLGAIQAKTLGDPAIAKAFPTDAFFDALRLDPYLRTLAGRHPDLAAPLLAVVNATARNKMALVHGDVSPKNILVARADAHPVLLDAECAWYGDPAFDAAFLLNHLLLKAVHLPALAPQLGAQAQNFFTLWLGHFPKATRVDLQARTAALLPCLLLARVDGKSPVEYLDPAEQQQVRDLAMPLIANPPAELATVIAKVTETR